MKPQKIIITAELAGKRIDTIAAQLFPEHSRSQWQKYGVFQIKGAKRPSAKKTKTQPDETWIVSYKKPTTADLSQAVAWDFPLEILAQSNSWRHTYIHAVDGS